MPRVYCDTVKRSSVCLAVFLSVVIAVSFTSCKKKEVPATKEATYTYRVTGSQPTTWSPTDCQLSSETLVLDCTCEGLYEFVLNDTRDGYDVRCGMATALPVDVTKEFAGKDPWGVPSDASKGYAWRITLRDDLKWDNGTPIDTSTVEYSIQQFLNPEMKNYRASLFYADSLILANGEDYYSGTCSWDKVGFIKNDNYTFTLVLKTSLSPFMILYNSSSIMLLREDLYEANKKKSGDIVKSSYGTSVETYASYGAYKVTEFQSDKYMRLTRNPSWHGWKDAEERGEFQTTDIYIQYIVEHSTVLNLFLQGKVDGVGLTATDMEKYGNSEFRMTNPQPYTWKFSFNSDKESLRRENTPGVNHVAISNKNFRKGISLSLDRQKYCDTITPGSDPMYGLLNYSYVAVPETGELYRDTDEAKFVLSSLYGIPDIDDITGLDIAAARKCFALAWKELLDAGDISASDTFAMDFHVYSSAESYARTSSFLQSCIDEGVKGTPFEGKITVNMVVDQDYYENLKKGNADVAMTSWGGSSYDPYGHLWCYCMPDVRNEYGFNPDTETVVINLDGKNIEKTFQEWYLALCNGEYSSASYDVRNKILANVELALLETYCMIPVRNFNTNSLVSQRLVEGADFYVNPLVERGGIRFRTYTMDDAEWDAYCKENGNQLTY